MRWLSGLLAFVLGCGSLGERVDAGADGGLVDAGAGDAGAGDAGAGDAGAGDAGAGDAGVGDAGVGDAGVGDAGGIDGGDLFPDGGVHLRLIAANLTSGNNQTYDPGDGVRILQALHGDVIGIQEMNYGDNSSNAMDRLAYEVFDAGVWWHRGSGRIPNGIISRYPIIDSGEWDDTRTTDRELTWAVVDLPGSMDLWVVSLHLLSNTPVNRAAQATQLVNLLQANVPAGMAIALMGDLNTDTRLEPALEVLDASVVTQGPWPTDGTLPDGGNGNTSTNRSRPYDWVLVSPRLDALEVPVVLEGQPFSDGLVFDTRLFSPLPPPALSTDSTATNMQHMAVVRDFVIVR